VQTLLDDAADLLTTNPTDTSLKSAVNGAETSFSAEGGVEKTNIEPTDQLNSYKGIDKDTVRGSNRYYSEYGTEYSVENLAWSADHVVQTCKEPLRNKILEGMVGVSF